MSWKPFRDARTRSEWRDYLMQRQRGLCAICGHRFPAAGELNAELEAAYAVTFDHIVPRSAGGRDVLTNLRLVHDLCNRFRGDGNGSRRVDSVPRVLR